FSGGQQARASLARMLLTDPDVMLLDEPTNHLDLEMRQALAVALQEFTGAMLIVSHDRHLLRVSTDELLLVDGGKIGEFEGSLDDYPAWLARRNSTSPSTSSPSGAGTDRKTERRAAAARRQALQPLKKKLQQAEKRLERLQQRQAELELALADNDLYQPHNLEKLQQLSREKRGLDQALEEQELLWMEAAEALEHAESLAVQLHAKHAS
ncbi:MAG TPA: ATP-binding cassette domain-containing protein, partial [Chromatiaceae bacterium]|nr:ATP-binding cassette domain-containing protein [Chromatiaceae bacterium]